MRGKQTSEYDVAFSAKDVWDIYSTLQLPAIIKTIPNYLQDIVVVGDGSVGTRFHLIVFPGPISSYWEVIAKLDHEKRIKEVDVIEGGVLEKGYTFFRTIFQILDKGPNLCTIKSEILYEINDQDAENEKLSSVSDLDPISKAVEKYLTDKNAGGSTPGFM